MQVVAEASDACARQLIARHRTPKIAAAVSDAVLNDKNPKLRQNCSMYLLQVRSWLWGISDLLLGGARVLSVGRQRVWCRAGCRRGARRQEAQAAAGLQHVPAAGAAAVDSVPHEGRVAMP